MNKPITFILVSFLFISCQQKNAEFIPIPDRIMIAKPEGNLQYYDVVFVANPPSDTVALLKMIMDYNNKTIGKDTIERKYTYFNRSFYRESYKTPRDFKDDESFSPERLEDHNYDFIAGYKMKRCRSDDSNSTYEWQLYSGIGYVGFETIYTGERCD